MTTSTYDIGDTRQLGVTFLDMSGSPIDPTNVTFKVRLPDGAITQWIYLTDAQVIRDALGVFHADYNFSQAGRHIFQWLAGGTLEAMEQTEIYIRNSKL